MLGMDFADGGQSPYLKRKDQLFGRPSGRPAGTVGTTGTVGGQAGLSGTGSGISGSMQQSPYAKFLGGLAKPITSPYQSQFKERAGLLREYTQGAFGTAAEGMREKMGGQGLTMGESGIADTAVGKIRQAGAETLSRGYRELATDEARREQEMGMGAAGLNLQRQLGGAGIALTGEEGALNRQMEYYRTKTGAETAKYQPWWESMAGGY